MECSKHLTSFLPEAAQRQPADMVQQAGSRARCIISPDHDGEGRSTCETTHAGTEPSGFDARHVPVVPGQIGDADLSHSRALLIRVKELVLAICRAGTHSASLWALVQANHLKPLLAKRSQQTSSASDALLPRRGRICFDRVLKGAKWLAEPNHLQVEPHLARATKACVFFAGNKR